MRPLIIVFSFVVLTGMEGGGCGGSDPEADEAGKELFNPSSLERWTAQSAGETYSLEFDFEPLVQTIMSAELFTPDGQHELRIAFVDAVGRGEMIDIDTGAREVVEARFLGDALELVLDPEGEARVVSFRPCPDCTR